MTLLLEFKFNVPSDSDADLPLVIQHFLRDSLNLDLTATYELDSNMSCPLDYGEFVIGSVFKFEVILFLERIYVHLIFIV